VGGDEIDIVDDGRVLEVWMVGDCGHFDRRLAGDRGRGQLRATRTKASFCLITISP
jgi:hypothetical protein